MLKRIDPATGADPLAAALAPLDRSRDESAAGLFPIAVAEWTESEEADKRNDE